MTLLDTMTDRYGSLWKRNMALCERLWRPTWGILGDDAVVLPLVGLGDDGLPNAASFKTRRSEATNALEAVLTWSEAPSAFVTPFDPTDPASYQGIVPIITFNGVDEEADSPDAAYWTRDDSGATPFSVGCWVNLKDATSATFLAKYDSGVGVREWVIQTGGTDQGTFLVYDEVNNITATRTIDAALSEGVWYHIVVTYDATGGATAMNGVTMYLDGAVATSTASNNGAYVSMVDTSVGLTLSKQRVTGAVFFDGKMAGGPCGPFFTQKELTPAEVNRLYNLGRAALGL